MTSPDPVPEDDALAGFGPRVRQARLARGMSARELAQTLGISPSAVSQIESGKIRPTMKRLHELVHALGIGLEDVFAGPAGSGRASARPGDERVPDGDGRGRLPGADGGASGLRRASGGEPAGLPAPVRADPPAVAGILHAGPHDHPRLVLEDGIEWFRISPGALPHLEVLRTVYPAGARTGHTAEFIQHTGWEMGYLLSGRMHVQVAFAERVVGPGESICFDSSVPHKLSNPFDEDAVALWIRGTTPNLGSG